MEFVQAFFSALVGGALRRDHRLGNQREKMSNNDNEESKRRSRRNLFKAGAAAGVAAALPARGNAWYLNQEDKLGSIEAGKLADLVVLDRDYFSVSNAEMRNIRPVSTVVDGKIVHNTGVL
jgi:predicted amidohydrolase YtcJ